MPIYESIDGTVRVTFQRAGSLVWQRWMIEYNKRHPAPQPPTKTIQLGSGDKTRYVEEPDYNDPTYKRDLQMHNVEFSYAMNEWYLSYFCDVDVPEDFTPLPGMTDVGLKGDAAKRARKVAYLMMALSDDDLENLVEAGQSLDNVTETGMDEAKKNSTDTTADKTSSP